MADVGAGASSKSLPSKVVAVGTSGGGLDTLKRFLGMLPDDSGAAFVVFAYPDHSQKPRPVELLYESTDMEVREVREDMELLPNTIYVIPPDRRATVEDGRLRLSEHEDASPNGLVDLFLTSLARDRGAGAVCVILSRTGAAGSAGLRELKKAGGAVFVHGRSSREFAGITGGVERVGTTDFVPRLEEIASRVVRHLIPVDGNDAFLPSDDDRDDPRRIERILKVLCDETNHDFCAYKRSTVSRRIQKRMLLANVPLLRDYVEMVEGNVAERTALIRDILIGVTKFFRDPDAFDSLRCNGLPDMFGKKGESEEVRAWVVGCSTGEEAYSLAMLVSEYMERIKKDSAIRIFATDVDRRAIEDARKGTYPSSIVQDVPRDLLKKYFTTTAAGFAVNPSLRDKVVFAQHDILKDPPFFNLDLVVCRNLLIYLTGDVQAEVPSLFHYALKPKGLLFLGPSESVSGLGALFEPLDKKWHIFRRRGTDLQRMGFPFQPQGPSFVNRMTPRREGVQIEPGRIMEQALAERYGRPSILTDRDLNVLRIHGDVNAFLDVPTGDLSSNLYKFLKREFRLQLRSALTRALDRNRTVEVRNLASGEDEGPSFDLVVEPLEAAAGSYMLITFEEKEPSVSDPDHRQTEVLTESEALIQLESELSSTREQLEEALDGYESLNEELKSSNEELMSMNEELQTSYEELETSKEELQALNEELTIVNQELQIKLDELADSNGYLENLFRSTKIAVLFLDKDMRIMRFTPAASEVFHLIESDVGRPIDHITSTLEHERVYEDSSRVLASLEPTEREVRTKEGTWFLSRIFPHEGARGDLEGVVLTFSEITELKHTQEELARLNEDLEARIEERTAELRTAREEAERRAAEAEAAEHALRESRSDLKRAQSVARVGSWRLDVRENRLEWSEESYRIFGIPQGTALSHELFLACVHPEDRDLVEGRWSKALLGEPYDVEHRILVDGRTKWVRELASLEFDGQGELVGSFGTVQDITERKEAEQEVRSLSRFPKENPNPVLRVASDGTILYSNLSGVSLLRHWNAKVGGRAHDSLLTLVTHGLAAGEVLQLEASIEDRSYALSLAPVSGEGYVNIYGLDITERKWAEEKFRRVFDASPEPMAIARWEDSRLLDANQAYVDFLGYPREELIGRSSVEVNIWVDLDERRTLRDILTKQGGERNFEARLRTGTGDIRTALISVDLVELGGLRCMLFVLKDISELKRNERLLERLAFEKSVLADASHRLSMANTMEGIAAVVRHAARELAEADGATFVLSDGDDCLYLDEEALSPLWKGSRFPKEKCISGWVMNNRRPAVIEDVYADPRIPEDLYRKTFVKSMIMVPVGTEASMAAIGVYWAEKRKPTPDALRIIQSMADLTAVAMENVRLYERLRRSDEDSRKQKELAEAANEAKSAFLARMSHEIRTPMNGVIGLTELALMSNPPEKIKGYLELLKGSGAHLLDVINDILDLSKIEAGKMEPVNVPFKPREEFEWLLDGLRATAEGRGLELTSRVSKEIPEVLVGDAGHLRQVLMNLAGNALKFTTEGRVGIEVDLDETPSEEEVRLRFRVEDTGIGIAPDQLESIFENYGQADASHHARYGGSGLGLTIARRLVELMGGSMSVRSTPGKGSIFQFTAMFGVSGALPKAPETPAGSPIVGSLRVLVAEDNLVNQMLAGHLLKEMGHEPVLVENGAEALEHLAEDRFDLVLMDVQMPVMDGEEATRRIREGEVPGLDTDIPIIALTAYAMKGDRERFLAAGMDDYLSKPVSIESLRRMMTTYVREGAREKTTETIDGRNHRSDTGV